MRQVIRSTTLAILLVVLAGCLPSLAPSGVLSINVTSATTAEIVFNPGEAAWDVALAFGLVDRVLTTTHALACQPAEELGTTCTVARLDGPLTLTVSAVDASRISASVWYTTVDGDQITRATP